MNTTPPDKETHSPEAGEVVHGFMSAVQRRAVGRITPRLLEEKGNRS